MIVIKKLFFLLVVSATLCVSCGGSLVKAPSLYTDVDGERYTSNIEPFVVDCNNVVDIKIPQNLSNDDELLLDVGEFFDSIRVVRLSSQSEALLGLIDKFVELDDRYIISDAQKARSVKSFDLNGNFICSYGRQGRGPGEYTEPTTFAVFDGVVKIYDQYQGKLVCYDLNGKYIKDVRVPFIFREFAQVDSNRYYFHCYMEDNIHLPAILDYMLVETDSNFVISKKGLHRTYGKYGRFGQKNLHYGNMGNFIAIRYVDTIYQVADNQTLMAKYFLDYGDRKLPEEYLLAENYSQAIEKANYDPRFLVSGTEIFDLEKFLVFKFTSKARSYTAFYDKQSGKSKFFNIHNGGTTISFAGNNYVYGNENYLIGTVDPTVVAECYTKFMEHIKHPAIDQNELKEYLKKAEKPLAWAKEVKEGDNLVLVYYYISEIE